MTDRQHLEDRHHLDEERSHGSGIRNADHGVGSDEHELPESEHGHAEDARPNGPPAHHYIDPAEAVMNSNPNLSPPIHIRH
jgi:hypothetical protein